MSTLCHVFKTTSRELAFTDALYATITGTFRDGYDDPMRRLGIASYGGVDAFHYGLPEPLEEGEE